MKIYEHQKFFDLRYHLLSVSEFIDEEEDLEWEMKLLIQGNESKEGEVHAPRVKRTQIIKDDDDEEVEMVKTKKWRDDQLEKRSRKSAKNTAADEIAKSIFNFNNTASCTVCAELKEGLDTVKSEPEEMKCTLDSMDFEAADFTSANEAKQAVIKILKAEIALAQITKSTEGKWEIHKCRLLN